SVSLNKEVKPEKNKDKNELVQSMLDSVSGGWVNAFARFTKRF
ncbi:putative rSAM-modified RiPP, XyeA family, partial [Vibrio agarivorans]